MKINHCLSAFLGFGLTAFTASSATYNDGYRTWTYDELGTVTIRSVDPATGSIEIPSSIYGVSVEYIGERAFADKTELESVVIPSSVTAVADEAFAGCSGLRSITIPENLENFGSQVFRGCTGLTNADGFVIVGNRLCAYVGSSADVVVPNGIKIVSASAFADNESITSVVFPAGVERIDGLAFVYCTGLMRASFPSSLTSLGSMSFLGCDSLRQVDFGGEPPSGMAGNGPNFSSSTRVWYNSLYENEWEDVFSTCGFAKTSPFLVSSVAQGTSVGPATAVTLTTSNVVVHYVTTEAALASVPVGRDEGFVMIVAEVKGGAFAVPLSWKDQYEPKFTQLFGSDLSKALALPSGKHDSFGNPMFVWQDYVAGTDPTDETDRLIASISVSDDGVVDIALNKRFTDGSRVYTTWGRKSLMDKSDWEKVSSGRESEYNFFRVTVEMKKN